tara:strand:- start:155 stop:874 length:720 start_codon:yes stop_codon:yes gene_type:complete
MLWWWNWHNRVLDCKAMFPKFSDNLVSNTKIIYQNLPAFEKYKNKTVLLIGGGGSTNTLSWEALNTYDYVWSVNHFYLHPVLKNTKVDLVMMMTEPDLQNEDWLEYRNRFNPYVGFEIHGDPHTKSKWKYYKFDDYEKYFCMHTRFYSKLGACVRMILFAAELGVSSLDFVGLDGPEAIAKGDHAFQPGKTTMPSNSGSFLEQYYSFWNYAMASYPDVSFYNLGGGEQYHKATLHHNTG